MENTDIKNYVKYIIFAGIIYAVLKVVPTKQLSNLEIMSLVCVILVGIFSLECLTSRKSNENMTDLKETMIDSNAKLFDLDMDIDLDFTKASKGLKENINTTSTTKSVDPLSDIIQKSKDKLEKKKEIKTKINSLDEEIGIDMEQVEEELSKRINSNQEDRRETREDRRETREDRRETREDRRETREDRREERDEIIKGRIEDRREERDEIIKGRREERDEIIKDRREERDEISKERIGKIKEERQLLEDDIKQKLQTYSEKSGVNCEVEVSKMRRELQDTIAKLKQEISNKNSKDDKSPFAKKYMSILIAELLGNKIIDRDDVENINAKLISGAVTTDETIQSLEKLRSIGKPKSVANPKDRQNDMKYSDLPANYYEPLGDKIANEWDNEYTLLNTDKWQIPQSRPPVCISSGPCKVCPTATEGYPLNLKDWDDSRVISNTKINKKWALDQTNSS
jgi:hypothetical protein